jgi:hypothetical protein
MNIIEAKPAGLYPEAAGTTSHRIEDNEYHTAYMVVGRLGDEVLVVEGTGPEKMAAIEHLVRKVKLVRDYMDLTCHGAFWQTMEEENRERKNEMRRMLGGLLGAPEPTPRKKDDGGLS